VSFHAELPSAPAGAQFFRTTSCPQCGQELPYPEWTEHLGDRDIRSNWSCEKCRCQFETAVARPSRWHCYF
jgi:hypothetical protein